MCISWPEANACSHVFANKVLSVCFYSCFSWFNVSPFFFQLYELDDDEKRKEFLDDLFSFMQKRGE